MTLVVTAPAPRFEGPPRLALAAAATALGDWLFYGHRLGISVAVFILVLAAGVVAGQVVRAHGRTRLVAIGLLVAGALPLVETLNALTLLLATIGLALFATLIVGATTPGLRAMLASALRVVCIGPFRLLPDALAHLRKRPAGRRRFSLAALAGWGVPVFFCGLFTLLFMSANPLIDGWVSGIRWSAPIERIDTARLVLWAILLSLAWAFLAMRAGSPSPRTNVAPARPEVAAASALSPLLGSTTVLRSLILFNLLFGVQSVLDLTYLWGGIALPDGMTYAAYAHRGAYPLIVTALLAGGFVLAVMAPGGASERSRTLRALVYLWIGQNLLLVTSSILRLDLYVAVYSLTIVRLAAFVWMGLVAVGLVLIVVRIALRRSNAWLLAANGLALVAVVYVFAFVNVAAFVADYNVAHSSDLGAGEQSFDVRYAMSLGPQAIPAVDRYLATRRDLTDDVVVRWRRTVAANQSVAMADWHGWTFRDWRLWRYLETSSR